MSEKIYIGVNNKAQEVKKLYVGVNGVARKVKKVYVGVNNKAQKVFESVKSWGKKLLPENATSNADITVSWGTSISSDVTQIYKMFDGDSKTYFEGSTQQEIKETTDLVLLEINDYRGQGAYYPLKVKALTFNTGIAGYAYIRYNSAPSADTINVVKVMCDQNGYGEYVFPETITTYRIGVLPPVYRTTTSASYTTNYYIRLYDFQIYVEE